MLMSDKRLLIGAQDPPKIWEWDPDLGDIAEMDPPLTGGDGVIAWQNETEQAGFSVSVSSITDGYRWLQIFNKT